MKERKSKSMFNPSIMTMIPATQLMYSNIPPIRKKVAETKIPRSMNTALKPKTKPTAVKTRFGLIENELSPDLSLEPNPTPPRILKYEGIKGSTQGERNESSPAAKTKNNESSSTIFVIIVL
jgi:hypothetical protein